MELAKQIEEAKKLVDTGYNYQELLDYMGQKKIYHSVLAVIFSKVFNVSLDIAINHVYEHPYYSKFTSEENKFNRDFLLNENRNTEDENNN